MATSLTSDIYHEYSCTPCRDDNENREAEVYCVNCKEYLCRRCFKYHNRLTGAREHRLLSKDEFQQMTTPTTSSMVQDLPTERCLRHHGKLVDMFCGDHDVVGCNTCMSLTHRACKDIFYIPDIAKSRVTKQSVHSIQDALSTLHHRTTALKDKCVENQSRVKKEENSFLDRVMQRRKEMDKHLDKLQKEQTSKTIGKFNMFNSKLGDDINSCDQTVTVLDQSLQNLSTSVSCHNTSQTFIHMKQAEQNVSKAYIDLKETDTNTNDSLCLQYKTDTNIKDVLSSNDLFGRLHAGIPTHADLEFVEDIKIKLDSDIDTCNCSDLCQLPDGTIIVTDWNNKNIKSLTYKTTYKLNDSLALSHRPWGVCCINDNDVAVTIPDGRKVEIISVKPKMTINISFSVDSPCFGIQYNGGDLFIGHRCDKRIKVYDVEENCVETYETDQKGEALFSEPRHLCVIPDQQQIAVADKYKGLVVINMSGQLVARHTYTNRQCTWGVCIDDRGNLVLTDKSSRQVVTVGVDKTCRTLLSKMDKDPLAVFFDKQTKNLIVTQFECDFMKSFVF